MDISRCSTQLLESLSGIGSLPEEVLELLYRGSNTQYLKTLSQLALDPTYTPTIFATHESVFVDVCSRWLSSPETEDLSALAALARILPSAPHLSVYAGYILKRKRGILEALASRQVMALQNLPTEKLEPMLLALCRLLMFNNEAFAPAISPAQIQVLLRHSRPNIRYLAIRILCLYLHASDAALKSMIESYIGGDEISGQWEDKIIDYSFFNLWEKRRLKDLDHMLRRTNKSHGAYVPGNTIPRNRVLEVGDFTATTACIAGVLIPRLGGKDVGISTLVQTETTKDNVHSFASAVRSSKPVLLTGCSGAGKSSMIRDVARELGKSSSMITLHLNEQTDSKLLIGMYTSATTPGSFSWSPGVLTAAVMEGRWVVIEDLDRAPTDVISVLLPLLERRELFIPNWGKRIQAAPGFKLIATVRSTLNPRGEEFVPATGMTGARHWLHVPVAMVSDIELSEIVVSRFPLLRVYVPKFLVVYQTFRHSNPLIVTKANTETKLSRPLGPSDLLRWCARVQDLLSASGITFGNEPISDGLHDQIFLEAVDCFVGAYPSGLQKANGIDIIAQGLHIPAERIRYCLEARRPEYLVIGSTLRVGRTYLPRRQKALRAKSAANRDTSSPFATTDHVVRILESIAVAVKQAEPCLLVGETGTGKTTVVQRLADALNRKLTVVNLSQQSEAGDLLGGYKPVNMMALAIPMKEEFDELLGLTFTSNPNTRYIETLGKSISKGRWARALTLWQEALRMIEEHLKLTGQITDVADQEPLSKKRKVRPQKLQKLKSRWDKFALDVQIFQMHLASGSKGFAFSFIEGNIVKAARNGEWVLLDEINLASPDTLESLADLFSNLADGGPSILLTESGNTERIYAHKDFRIFGAMNPATDIGKRDLPMSLRSRFTELFIEAPDKDLENLVSVTKAYLGNHNHVDVHAATDIAHLYLEIKKRASDNRLVDGANQKPHFSLRTLTRTLIYVLDIAPIYGLRRALFEGFSMSFLTVLDRNSEMLLQPLIDKHIMSGQKNSRALLHKTPHLPQDGKNYVQFRHYWISQGPRPVEEQVDYIVTPFIERNLLNLVRATSTRRFPVLLQGPTSSGKTSMIEYLARISGNSFVRINNHEHTDLQEYLGSYISGPDGRLVYQEGVLVHALRNGSWVVLDELNLAPTDVLEALNRLLDDNRELLIPETQQIVRPHEDFMLFATQNPAGIYGGRKVLSRAFRNRFLEIHFDDIPENELETILRERSQIAPSFCNKIVKVYKELSRLRQSERIFEQKNSFATLRDLFRWALREADVQEQLAINGFLLLAERVRNQEERSAVKKVIEDVMKIKLDDHNLYSVNRTQRFLRSTESSSLDIVWTKSIRRLFTLVSEALKNNEPVLLIGETGTGKTTICQYIAEIAYKKLQIVNAHQNMETGDLIGAQRPIRNKAHAESRLAQDLVDVLRACDAYEADHEHDIHALLESYAALQRQAPAILSDEMRLRIVQSKTRANSLFEWADGSLVNAMRNGQPFLLDEISLADDSVLERLNSVLEPGRTLFLAEKGTADALVTAAPGFQFLATMNPGGDYGKRELSPALRNRFTEIWVPNASSEEEMLEVVQAKLTPQFSRFCKPMVSFAAWYSARYNVSEPHISIRDLLSWVQFANGFHESDTRLGLSHGAAMVYLDGLGANPSSKISISESDVDIERCACLSKLNEVFGQDLSSVYNQKYHLCSTSESFGIGPFTLPKSREAQMDSKYNLRAPTTMANALKVARSLRLSKPILIEGSPGVGKTTLVAAIAHAVGIPLTRINLSDQTDLMDLFGSDVPVEGARAGNFTWRDAPFLRAMQQGEWVLLDEMNLASQSVLEGLNACLDHRGQVYISELDQTFEKHPSFVVFAAQNPHLQGGGRKGLPASFVNRFTVVHAGAFSQEDLSLISSELFPNISGDVRDKILRSVTALSQLLREDPRFGDHGGPWEVNLRDVLRWFQLITDEYGLMPLANPADFQHLLFLQRFRTFEDLVAVSKLMEDYMPQDQSRTLFQTKGESLLEIGLGVLSRDLMLQPKSISGSRKPSVNLKIAESVIFCIQKKWPCLLVGGSGSGKSSTIAQLASTVGADVVEISMNSEMDTVDLVGTYEQMDPQRATVEFIRRLHQTTCRDLISDLTSEIGNMDNLAALESSLRLPTVALIDVLPLIGKVAEENRKLKYKDFAIECESLMSQSKTDTRARFEWVDGILVKALQQGKWVILDNANLCNPSVLDRLNSLLEPDGFLSINEHRNPDGSAQIIKPHQDFRLFMTTDPRHGELSRAMRNRSVELFMTSQPQSLSMDVPYSSCESFVSRFEVFQAFDWNSLDDNGFRDILSLCFDHLTFTDLKLCRRWEAQFLKGLDDLSPSRQSLYSQTAKTYRMSSAFDGSTFGAIHDTYLQMGEDLSLSLADIGSMQTIHPYNNPILVSATEHNPRSRSLRRLGARFEFLVGVYGYMQKLVFVDQNLYSGVRSPCSRLERSMVFLKDGKFHRDTTRPLASFLQEMGDCLRSSTDNEDLDRREIRGEESSLPWDVLNYLQDVFDLAHSADFDEGVFQVYQMIGRSLCDQSRFQGSLQSDVSRELSTKLDAFDNSWRLSSGLSMENLWKAFRPATARDLSQLKFSLRVKGFGDRFDTIRWSSGASVQELETLQNSVISLHDAGIDTSSISFAALDDIQKTLEDLESKSSPVHVSLPYFQSEFEALCQYDAWQARNASTSRSMLSLLAGRSTAQSMKFNSTTANSTVLLRLRGMTADGHPDMELGAIRDVLPVSLLQKLENIEEVPLHSLELLRAEIELIASGLMTRIEAIQDKPLNHLNDMWGTLQSEVQEALDVPAHADPAQVQIGQLIQRFGGTSLDAVTLDRRIHHLRLCVGSISQSRTFDSFGSLGESQPRFLAAASRCVQFFTGCLLQYVPDRCFDPALRAIVDLQRHNKRKVELASKVKALQDFETVFSGQTSSFRIRLAEQKLEALGVEPEVPNIVRPQVSELGSLQAEFNNILSSIILRSPESSTLQSVYEGQPPQVQEIKLLRANIAQAILRLTQSFHAYSDITEPLIAMLQGLDIGLALAFLSNTKMELDDGAIKFLCNATPFLGGDPESVSNITFFNLQKQRSDQADHHLHLLSLVALERSVSDELKASSVETMFQAFHSLYEEWKARLSHDQQQSAANSSLYRYRGSEEDRDEAEDQDLRQLFPDYDHPHKDGSEQMKGRKGDPKEQARRVAQLQRDIFQNTQSTSEALLRLLRHTSQQIAGLWKDHSSRSISPIPTKTLLPALVLRLYETKDRLHGEASQNNLYNFYTDANLAEAQKLINLVRKIETRFADLQGIWPEHATLGEVLRTSSELLALRHTEPIAKLITKTEQLHGYVHEWQVVASKQYTAVTVYDQLTELLVSWRRLELSTWAGLLDMEDQKFNDDADAWWFVAYEVIVAAPLSMLNTGEDVRVHAERLFSTLADFMTTTSIGQYTRRLGMIKCFKSHLGLLEKDVPSMIVMLNAIRNFLSYYTRFEIPIRDYLRKRRQPLEKDMKEILLLASWKDTNINALRESAKRSHHKLFKVIRKYRELLAQAAETIIGQDLPEMSDLPPSSLSSIVPTQSVDSRALEFCQQYLSTWQTKSERFTKPTSTADRMLRISLPILTGFDAASHLDSFGAQLNASTNALRQETPSKATKENAEMIKHLKARKRKLFADTLKSLRRMGFRSNMSADTLAKQASTAAVLTHTPAFGNTRYRSDSNAADYFFHKFLSLMPQTKEKARAHSEDLTHGEVAKSLGYLESMLSMILRQRTTLASTRRHLDAFAKTIETMKGLWAPDSHTVRYQPRNKAYAAGQVQHVLKWLPSILKTGSVIIENQAKLGGADMSNLLRGLQHWKERMVTSVKAINELPFMPIGLTSSRHDQVLADAEGLLQGLKAYLRSLMESNPELAHVLRQIELWTNAKDGTGHETLNGIQSYSLNALDDAISRVVDSVLVAIQRTQDSVTAMPTSDEAVAWLTYTDTTLAGRLKNLRGAEVNQTLEDAISRIKDLDSVNEQNLSVAGAMCAMTLPILEQYQSIYEAALHQEFKLNGSLCKLSSLLAHSFRQIAVDGFCSPAENTATETGKSEKLEGGTGLGDGEGAEDISKDIQDDEDLTEIAQGANKDKEREDIENQEDAIDMNRDEMEGDMGEGSEKEDDKDGSNNEGDENDIDEEVGSVDDLDPTAVDEKLWDGKAEDSEKRKEGSKSKGEIEKDEQMAVDSATQEAKNAEEDNHNDAEMSDEGAEQGDEIAKEETEKLDPHAQEERKLDLPEDMDLDNLDGAETEPESEDSDMDGMSDIGQEQAGAKTVNGEDSDDLDNETEDLAEAPQVQSDDIDETEEEASDAAAAQSPVDTEPSDDGQREDDDQGLLHDRSDNAAVDPENAAPSDVRGLGEDIDLEQDDDQASTNQAPASKGTKGSASYRDDPAAAGEDGQLDPSKDRSSDNGQTRDSPQDNGNPRQAFKKLGDALERWHRHNKEIQDATEQKEKHPLATEDVNGADQEFEHLQDEEADGDTQALGAATDEQARALDENAMNSEMRSETRDFPLDQTDEEVAPDQDQQLEGAPDNIKEGSKDQHQQPRPSTFVHNDLNQSAGSDQANTSGPQKDESMDELDNDFSTTHLKTTKEDPARSAEEARHLWLHYESLTRELSFSLTEQLRLILAPTLATKMRGDFRTGKRLNIKRIIPYIASQYKRDKIWMRRSIPSKRNYQIMLAVDDSKSMGESGSGQLAFQTLALVAKSLSMLEVGEICVVGFGNEIHVAHAFDKPFSSEAGAQVFQHFGFQQTQTNVRKLVAESIGLFREARRKTFNAGTDLWQLELIVSDGVCEDHETIRRLVRQAQEERIMIVFVIVDALLKGESIMDMKQAIFTDGGDITMKRYLDGFPFPYYLVVADVKELPGVLAQALRQWFSEVVESG